MADSLIPVEGNQPSERDELLSKWKDKTPEEVLNAKVESDLYIKTLTARIDDLKADYLALREQEKAREQLESLIDKIEQSKNPANIQLPRDNPPSLKIEDIESLLDKKLTERQIANKQQDNLNAVQARLKQAFGEDYVNTYKQKLNQLGITQEYADDLAKNQPTVFVKVFDLEPNQRNLPPTLPRSSQQTTTYAKPPLKRDWNYYQELKKTNPKLYLDREIAIQMHNDALELGADFGMPLG